MDAAIDAPEASIRACHLGDFTFIVLTGLLLPFVIDINLPPCLLLFGKSEGPTADFFLAFDACTSLSRTLMSSSSDFAILVLAVFSPPADLSVICGREFF